jgi:hypothetical protein
VQNTLLGFAIVIILALVTALVAPLFIDWGRYRGEFQATAGRLTGLQVKISGPIDARLLPIPTLTLQQIEVSRPGQAGTVKAQSLGIEFALGALIRGEWRAAEVHLTGAEFALGLDAAGRLDWPAPSMGKDPESIAVERLDIRDSRAVLTDATSGSRLVLDQLDFKGDLRSLLGPLKGEGSFVAGGQHFPYRVSASRPGEDGAVKLKFSVDPIDRPLTAELDVWLAIDNGMPRYEGSVQFARPVGRAPEGGQALIVEPWRIASRIKGDGAAAVLEQVEFQYGPDERAIKLRGDAKLTFGRKPGLDGVLSATHVDVDRLLALPEPMRRRPLVAIKSLADYLIGAQNFPVPVKLGITVESLTLAGATLQRASGDVRSEADGWDIESLELRAPGTTRVQLSGSLTRGAKGVSFAGPARIEARDPRALLAWLADRSEVPALPGPLRAEGEVKLGSEAIALEQLTARLDRMTLTGRLAYSWASEDRPARIEAMLNAPELDLDRAQIIARGMFGDTAFEWPREGALSISVGRAFIAGVEAKRADVKMQFDARGLDIERLAIGDFGGAALTVSGRIDTRSKSPRGALTLALDARGIEGVAALTEKIAPQAAEQLRRSAGRFMPARLRASLTVDADAGVPDAAASAKFKIDGSAGAFRISLQGEGGGEARDGAASTDIAGLVTEKINLTGRIEGGDGSALVDLLGLGSLLATDGKPGQLTFAANGPPAGQMAIEGQLTASGLDLAAKGSMRLLGHQGPNADLALKVGSANLRLAHRAGAARARDTVPAAFTAKMVLAEGTARLTELAGTLAGAEISGRLAVGLEQPAAIEGDIALGNVDLPAAFAAAIGVPAQAPGSTALWPSEPFEAGVIGGLDGRVTIRAARMALTPKLSASDVRGVLHFDQSELSLTEIDGSLAGGRVAGDITFERGKDGLAARGRLRVAGADAAELLPAQGSPPLNGRLTFDVAVDGSGRSPGALIGSLAGNGTFTLQDGRLARLDPAAFDAIIKAADQGLPIDAVRVRDRMETALANGGLPIPLAAGEISIKAGQARLGNMMIRAQGAELGLNAGMDLTDNALDVRLTLSGPAAADSVVTSRPQIAIALKGAFDAPRRILDVNAFSSWLALRAVEQQARRLDALESGREQPVAPPAPATLSAPSAPIAAPAAPAASPNAPAATKRTTTVPVQPGPTVRNQEPKREPARTTTPAAPPLNLTPPAPRADSTIPWSERR